MIVELGHYALVLALALALVQAVVPIWGARIGDAALMATAGPTAAGQFLFVALSFAALTWAHVVSDFSVANVFENSHSLKPMIYKISGVWGNHEGSMLLWVTILALFGALVAVFGRNLPPILKADVLGVQAWVAAAFYLFVLVTSNPFARLVSPPLEGRDLNPVLQDPGLAIHPPLLYLGYVGFSIAFSFAVAALIEGRIDAAWARWVRPWTLAAWVFLTLGIAMGSYWAYYELGWGGWWFWDPVENASLMPWLAGTALLHSAIVMEKRDALKIWTILLAVLAFSLSLLGTFLVRSGVLTSVHAFASDPTRGVFILAILVAFIGGSLTLFAIRAPGLTKGGLFAPISREGALVFNNLFLTSACAAVFFGTLYPLMLEAATGAKISVGAPFFDATFGPLMVPLLIAVPIGPFLAWKRGDLLAVAQRLAAVLALAMAGFAVTWWATRGGPVLAPLGVGLALWLVLGALAEVAFRVHLFSEAPRNALRRAVGLPRSAWGTMFAHLGLGLTLLGIVAESNWRIESILVMKPGDTVQVGRFSLAFDGVVMRRGPNFDEAVAGFAVRDGGGRPFRMEPSKRTFRARPMPTTETAIATYDGFSQLYLSLGDTQADGGVAMRIYWKPLVLLIWLGCVAMALGGCISLTDRRLRIGAPRPHRVAAEPPAGDPQPAE
ncbi:heme lyase CcmF/NrfE family subunit [Siculibacillus lacustris]|uniref:Heme lyase CcmF/NrfE family subunit n=1 Tax=Siculibacillus lacustris TaxID=1549641 RepID=A0A4Q9VX62_9HYPH|nr:heme lyase CcmF/NrfE family subunit [Siculibacillus lacustris]TBW40968.1 heme lyase CcmF/NrfE family subunit [Siculibacillus lacustris]